SQIAALVVVLMTPAAFPAPRHTAVQPAPTTVGVGAAEGGTVLVTVEDSPAALRLFGIEAPPRGDPLGEQAIELVRAVVADQPLLLELCGELAAPDGAPLWNVTTLDENGEQVAWVNGLLVAAGLARVPDAAA